MVGLWSGQLEHQKAYNHAGFKTLFLRGNMISHPPAEKKENNHDKEEKE